MGDIVAHHRYPHLKRVVSNIGWLTFDKVFRLGLGVFISVAIARYLGPKQFGQLNYGTAMFFLFSVLASLGLDSVVQRDLVSIPSDKDRLLGTCFVLKTAAGITCYLLLLVVARQLAHEVTTRAVCFIIGLSLLANGSFTFDNWFQSQTEAKFTVYAQNMAFFCITLVRIGLLFAGAGLLAFAWAISAEVILAILLSIILFRVVVGSLRNWRFDLRLAQGWIVQSWPLLLSGLAIIIYTRIDQVMLAQYADDHALGIYSAAVKVSEIGYFVPSILATSFFPSIVRTRELNSKDYEIRRQHYFDLSVVLAVGIALPTTILSRPIILLLYGNSYVESVPILCALAWAGIFVFTGWARHQYLVCEGYMKFSFIANLAAAVLNIGLNVFLIPRYQGFGAAIATLISYGLSSVCSSFFYRPTRIIGLEQLKAFNIFAAVWRLIAYSRSVHLVT
jgi:PST family polysaccharide transporter